MNTQPKSHAADKAWSERLTAKSTAPIMKPEADRAQEWTPRECVGGGWQIDGSGLGWLFAAKQARDVADARNASITAERENTRRWAIEAHNSAKSAQQLREQLAEVRREHGSDAFDRLNRELEEARTQLAAEKERYPKFAGELAERAEQQLAAERERADHNSDIGDSIARASRQVEDRLSKQLAAAQAAFKQLKAAIRDVHWHGKPLSETLNIDINDATALSAAIAAAQQPLVELLERVADCLKNWDYGTGLPSLRKEILAALAKVEEGQSD